MSSRSRRKNGLDTSWLTGLSAEDVKRRWPVSGLAGLYEHERQWCANHQDTEVRELAIAYWNAKAERLQQTTLANGLKAGSVKALVLQHVKGGNHSVRDAAHRASTLYMDNPIPRSLKQCIAIAAAEHQVSWSSIELYLAGVGVRVLWSSLTPEEIWGAECFDSHLPLPATGGTQC